ADCGPPSVMSTCWGAGAVQCSCAAASSTVDSAVTLIRYNVPSKLQSNSAAAVMLKAIGVGAEVVVDGAVVAGVVVVGAAVDAAGGSPVGLAVAEGLPATPSPGSGP